MNFVFSLFFYLIYPSPELIKDHYFTFYHKEMFYIIEKDSIHQTLDGREFKSWSHENSLDHFNFGFLNADDQTYLISEGGGSSVPF